MTQVRCTHFIYCIQQVIPGWFVILNREYKPLGYLGHKWVDYRDYMVRIRGLGPAKAKRLSYKGSTDLDFITLYNDGCVPTQDPEYESEYLKRLSILLHLKIDEDAIKPPKPVSPRFEHKETKIQIEESDIALNAGGHYKLRVNPTIKFLAGILHLATRNFRKRE